MNNNNTSATAINTDNLTAESLALLVEIVGNIRNWNGTPPCFDHINAARRGNLTDLKKRNLLRTFRDEGEEWIDVSDEAVAYVKGLKA